MFIVVSFPYYLKNIVQNPKSFPEIVFDVLSIYLAMNL